MGFVKDSECFIFSNQVVCLLGQRGNPIPVSRGVVDEALDLLRVLLRGVSQDAFDGGDLVHFHIGDIRHVSVEVIVDNAQNQFLTCIHDITNFQNAFGLVLKR